eukprot:ctg_213.g97
MVDPVASPDRLEDGQHTGVDGDECLYYVVTAAKPTVVTHARVGRFLAPDRQHLLLARLNRVDVYEVDATADSVEDGERGVLRACLELPVYGRVVALEVLPGDAVAGKRAGASRRKETSTSAASGTSSDAGHQKRARTGTRASSSQRTGAADSPPRAAAADDELATDTLFLLTEALQFAVLRYDAASCLVETVARGSVRSKIGKPCTRGQFVAVDPEYRCIALHVYESVLKIIPGHWGSEAFDVRIDALEVQSLVFLKGTATPTLAILHADYTRNRHLLTYEVLLEERDLREGPCSYTYVDSSAELLFAVPPGAGAAGGVVIAGDQSLTLYAGVGDHVKRVITLPNDELVSMRCVTPLPTDGDALLSGIAVPAADRPRNGDAAGVHRRRQRRQHHGLPGSWIRVCRLGMRRLAADTAATATSVYFCDGAGDNTVPNQQRLRSEHLGASNTVHDAARGAYPGGAGAAELHAPGPDPGLCGDRRGRCRSGSNDHLLGGIALWIAAGRAQRHWHHRARLDGAARHQGPLRLETASDR